LNATKFFADVAKIPIIGDLIIAFAIIVVFISLSSAGGYFGLEGEQKQFMINIFISIGILYFAMAVIYRIYTYIKNRRIIK
jgi:hypothetical protein